MRQCPEFKLVTRQADFEFRSRYEAAARSLSQELQQAMGNRSVTPAWSAEGGLGRARGGDFGAPDEGEEEALYTRRTELEAVLAVQQARYAQTRQGKGARVAAHTHTCRSPAHCVTTTHNHPHTYLTRDSCCFRKHSWCAFRTKLRVLPPLPLVRRLDSSSYRYSPDAAIPVRVSLTRARSQSWPQASPSATASHSPSLP